MNSRLPCCLLLAVFSLLAFAKDNNKSTLPEFVLQARTVEIVVSSDHGQTISHPIADSNAQQAVERALTAWGRFTVVKGQESDLVIVVRAGGSKIVSPTVETGSTDSRESVQLGNGNVRIFGRQGETPAVSDPTYEPKHGGTHVGKEIGRGEDSFEVYKGGGAYSRNSSPEWRYIAKDALKEPKVVAVEQFRKAVDATERNQKKSKKP